MAGIPEIVIVQENEDDHDFDHYFVDGNIDGDGKINLNTYHNNIPLDDLSEISEQEETILLAIGKAVREFEDLTDNIETINQSTTEISYTTVTDLTDLVDLKIVSLSTFDNKDVKVFLNFTYNDESFLLEENLSNPKHTENLTSKIINQLNSGVGYVIVPDGEKPETEDQETIHLMQTRELDQAGGP